MFSARNVVAVRDSELAEREGFEPPVPVKARTLSRRLVSTTHPSLRVVGAPASFLILSVRRIFTYRPASSLNAAGILAP